MTQTRSKQFGLGGAAAGSRRGAVLVLVVFFIFLASALSVLIMANSVQLIRTNRQQHELVLLRQMTDSARAWLSANENRLSDAPLTLDAQSLLPDSMSGSVQIRPARDVGGAVVIDARITMANGNLQRSIRFKMSSRPGHP